MEDKKPAAIIPLEPDYSGRRLSHFNARLDSEPFVHDLIEMKHSDFRVATTGFEFNLIIVSVTKEKRKYAGSRSPCIVYKLVLMDRTMCLVHAAIGSRSSSELHGEKNLIGSTIKLKDFFPAWHEPNGLYEKKVSLIINEFDLTMAPVGTPVALDWEDAHWKEYFVDRIPINKCMQNKLIVHLEPLVLESMQTVWREADSNMIHRTGSFIDDEEARHEYLRSLRRSKDGNASDDSSSGSDKENPNCECATRFLLKQCCLITKPITSIDQNGIFEDACDRLNGEVAAPEFDSLVPRHKRWCYFNCCCVNIIYTSAVCGPKKNRIVLPKCLLKKVRSTFPNRKGEPYTGFRPKICMEI